MRDIEIIINYVNLPRESKNNIEALVEYLRESNEEEKQEIYQTINEILHPELIGKVIIRQNKPVNS